MRGKLTGKSKVEKDSFPAKREILGFLCLAKDLSDADILMTNSPKEAEFRRDRNQKEIEKTCRKFMTLSQLLQLKNIKCKNFSRKSNFDSIYSSYECKKIEQA